MASKVSDVGSHDVLLTPEAEASYLKISAKADLKEVDSILDALGIAPGIGRTYDPLYEAAKPNIDGLLVAYAGHYGIYYVADEREARVMVLAIEDQRRNPMERFDS